MSNISADVIVIGSGAGGSAVAYSLATAGFDVVVLEKGKRYSRSDFLHDEMTARNAHNVFVPSIDDDPHVLVDHSEERSIPRRSTVGWTAVCLGGGTTHMGATLQRFHPSDFIIGSANRDIAGVIDWPYRYDDIEPYYAQAEWLLGVCGQEAGIPRAMQRSRPYPMAAFPSHRVGARFDDVVLRRRLTPMRTPRGINSVSYDGRPACELCDMCSGYGCPVGARASAPETLIRRAERTGNCRIVTEAAVERLVADASSQIAAVEYRDCTGARHIAKGRIVCLASGAIESARLLLLSRGPHCPDGVSNSSGQVGRNLLFQSSSSGWGEFAWPIEAPTTGTLDRGLMDFYFAPTSVSPIGKGGFVSFQLERQQPVARAEDLATGLGVLDEADLVWGADLKRRLKGFFREHITVGFELFHDAVPNASTFVELDPQITDARGMPSARIHYMADASYARVGRWVTSACLDVLRDMGATRTAERSVGGKNPYMAVGTCRSSPDADSGVVDRFGRSHEIRNLFVLDGGFLPTTGGMPVTLTIVANALRASEFISSRARTGDL